MAIVQHRIGGWEDEQCVAYLEYDDSNMRVTGIRVINNTSYFLWIGAIRSSDRLLYESRFPTGETYIAIPTTGPGRITIQVLERGHLAGIELMTMLSLTG